MVFTICVSDDEDELCLRISLYMYANEFVRLFSRTLGRSQSSPLFYSNRTNCEAVLTCPDLFNFPLSNTIVFLSSLHLFHNCASDGISLCALPEHAKQIENQMVDSVSFFTVH